MRIIAYLTCSIRRKLFFSFAIVMALVLSVALTGYHQLGQLESLSEQVVPNSLQMNLLQDLALSISSLDANVERILVIGGVQFQEDAIQDLRDMAGTLDAMKAHANEQTMPKIEELERVTAGLETDVLTLMEMVSTGSTPGKMNEKMLSLYSQIRRARQLHREISTVTLAQLQDTVVGQKSIIANLTGQSLVGVLVFLLVVLLSLSLSHIISRPVIRLRDAAIAVGEGKLDTQIRIESSDEIGQLARAFNRMVKSIWQAEEALRRERDLVMRIMETSPVGVTVVDREGKIVFANTQATQVLGLTKDEITQRTYNAPEWRITDYEGQPFPDEKLPFRQIVDTGQPVFDVRHAIEEPDGRRVLLSINATPLFDKIGQVDGMVSTVENITARVRAEEERECLLAAEREQRELAETLCEVASALVTTLDLEQVLDRILIHLEQVIPYDSASVLLREREWLHAMAGRGFPAPGQVVGQYYSMANDLLYQEIQSVARPIYLLDAQTDPRFQHWGGTSYVRGWMGVPLMAHGEVIGVLTLDSRRVAAYGEVEVALAQAFAAHAAIAIHNARLFAEAQAAYEKLKQTQVQLVQSAKLAAIGELAASVAHEINNPLTSVLGFAELLLKQTTLDDPIRNHLTTIANEARRTRDIVRGLLAFARQTELCRVWTDLNQVVQDTLALSRKRLEHGGVVVDERYAPNLPTLRLDIGRMKQVVLNLITNALHAMPQGGTLTVTTERVGDEVVLCMADTGEGIPAENLPRIFEPFFTTKPMDQGTGLGLSISLGIVKEHGGRIEVESRVGEGSTFTVSLPVEGNDG